jgi:hypothetical protein
MLGGLVVVVAIVCFVMYSGGKIGVAPANQKLNRASWVDTP